MSTARHRQAVLSVLSRRVSAGFSPAARALSSLSSGSRNNERVSLQDYVWQLQQLGNAGEASHGKSVHSTIVKLGFDRDVFVANNILRFYNLCGDLSCVRRLFDGMPQRNLVSWTSLISCYVRNRKYEDGLCVYSLMCRSGVMPNEFGFSLALKACRVVEDLDMGLLIHGQIIKCGFHLYRFCITSLLGVYVGYGNVEAGRLLFYSVPLGEESEALWNTLLNGYVMSSDTEEAFRLFNQMAHSNSPPNGLTYSIVVKLCADTLGLEMGKSMHSRIVKVGLEDNVFVGGSLVDCYSKLGYLDGALKLFENLEVKDNMVCCTLLSQFYQISEANQGLKFYIKFLSEGNKPDAYTLASVLSLCSIVESATLGSLVHCSIIKYGFELDSILGSAIIEVYGGVGMMSDAYKCFLDVIDKNEVCFGVMINNLVLSSNDEKALILFHELRNHGLSPDNSILSYILHAFANLHLLLAGKSIHCCMIKNYHNSDSKSCIENALIDMYIACGAIDYAELVLKEMDCQSEFSWTNVISGYCEMGYFEEALRLFREMHYTLNSLRPSQFTHVNVLQACSKTEAPARGKQIHAFIIKQGFDSYLFVQSSLINMYGGSKEGICDAHQVFSFMKKRDLVSWSSMITAWTQNGYLEDALKVFAEFQHSPDYVVDNSTLSSCISASAGLAALDMGKAFHSFAVKMGFASHLHVESSIVDMYCKCGTLEDAQKVFNEKRGNSLVSWTALMSGYANHGYGKEATELFYEMKRTGLDPDGITFISILMACSHAGLVNEGWQFFESLKKEHSSELTINHYACMVDLLGRADKVDEAVNFIEKSPFRSIPCLWKTLLGSCRKHGNVEWGNSIAGILAELGAEDSSNYVLLSNIYASADIWDRSMEFRKRSKEVKYCKRPGMSWIQSV